MMLKDEFKQIETKSRMKNCPFCGSDAELWEYRNAQDNYVKVVMCTNFGDSEGADECPMYMPNDGFYKATKREAINEWNKRPAPKLRLVPSSS